MTDRRNHHDRAPPPHERRSREESPPFWGSWGRIYLLVAGLLAVETVLFWWLARWAS